MYLRRNLDELENVPNEIIRPTKWILSCCMSYMMLTHHPWTCAGTNH